MRQRRYLFATPFVIIASCKRPLPPPETPPSPDAAVDAAQPDAAIDAPEADAPVDAAIDAPRASVRIEQTPPNKRECCANPPGPMRVRVINTLVQGPDVIVTLAMPDGERWDPDRLEGSIVKGDTRTPLPRGELVLVKCDRRTCTGKAKLTYDQVQANPNAVIRWR